MAKKSASFYTDADLMIDRTHYYVQRRGGGGGEGQVFCIIVRALLL